MINVFKKLVSLALVGSSFGLGQLAIADCPAQLSEFNGSQLTSAGRGLAVDRAAGKMWLDCRLVSANEFDCRADNKKLSWSDLELTLVQINQNGLLGYRDWRMPTIKELLSVVSRDCYVVDWAERRFVSEIPASYYWINKPYVLNSKIGFDVRNNHSYTLIGYYPYMKRYVHLVRDM